MEEQGRGGEIEQGKRRVELMMKKKRKSKNKGWVGRQERIDGRRKKEGRKNTKK